MAVKRIDPEKCVGCGECVKSCPADVFRFNSETHKSEVCYPQDCGLCMWCVSVCNFGAVELTPDREFKVFTAWG